MPTGKKYSDRFLFAASVVFFFLGLVESIRCALALIDTDGHNPIAMAGVSSLWFYLSHLHYNVWQLQADIEVLESYVDE